MPGSIDITSLKPQEIDQSQLNVRRIIDYNWSISYDLKLTTSIVDRG